MLVHKLKTKLNTELDGTRQIFRCLSLHLPSCLNKLKYPKNFNGVNKILIKAVNYALKETKNLYLFLE